MDRKFEYDQNRMDDMAVRMRRVGYTEDEIEEELEGIRRSQRETERLLTGISEFKANTKMKAESNREYVPFEHIRRITGCLVGTTERFNNAQRAEERERVKHGMCGCE